MKKLIQLAVGLGVALVCFNVQPVAADIVSLAPSVVEHYVLPGDSITQAVTLNQTNIEPVQYSTHINVPENCHCTIDAEQTEFTVEQEYLFTYTIHTSIDSPVGTYPIQVQFVQEQDVQADQGSSVQFGITHLSTVQITHDTALTIPNETAVQGDNYSDLDLVHLPVAYVQSDAAAVEQTVEIDSSHSSGIQYLPYRVIIKRNGRTITTTDSVASSVIAPGANRLSIPLATPTIKTIAWYQAEIQLNGHTETTEWMVYNQTWVITLLCVVSILLVAFIAYLQLRQRN